MTARTGLRFDIDALRVSVGDKMFDRGQAYHRGGNVRILALEPTRVLAQVAGTEDYRTEVVGRGKKIGGNCSCPAFEDRGFCKHMVATALAAEAAGRDGDAEGVGVISRIRAHLNEKGVDALVDMIVDMAMEDLALLARLEMAAASRQADDKTLDAALRKAIDRATRTGGYVEYREASAWAAAIRDVLDAVADLVSADRAKLALDLVERAIDRIEKAAHSVDDSDGHVGGLLDRACEIHLAAALAARPEPLNLARTLFSRELRGEYDTFRLAVARYADVLGEEGLEEYRRLASEAWAKLPARGKRARSGADGADYFQLAPILDFFAERNGDLGARIALRAKDLSSPWDYLRLAEFCAQHGREEEALRRAEEGLWVFEDGRSDERLVLFAVGLLSKAGRKADAEAHLWRAFEKAPSRELYTRLGKIGGDSARGRALDLLESRCMQSNGDTWRKPVDLLVGILSQGKAFDAAWAALRKFGGSDYLKQDLARASEKTHPAEAIEVYRASVEQMAKSGSYAEAAKLIARMAKLQSAAEHAAYVLALKARHRLKRNFMKLLG